MNPNPEPEVVKRRLWDAIADTRFGMLAANPSDHMQPMTAFSEPDQEVVSFLTNDDTDLVRSIDGSTNAHFAIVAKDQSVWGCLRGTLSVRRDQAVIDKHWSPFVAAWYPGKDRTDPSITVLELAVSDADVWLSETGSLKFALEIAKANLTDTAPAVGARARVETQK